MSNESSLIIILEDTEHLNIKSWESAVDRHYRYVKEKDVEIKVFCNSNYLEVFIYLEKLPDEVKIFYKYLDYNFSIENLIKSVTPEIARFDESNKYTFFEVCKRHVCNIFVKNYSHAAGGDLVNSEVGVLNVLCYNPDCIKNENLKDDSLKKAKELFNNFHSQYKNHFDKYKTVSGLKNQINLLENLIKEIMSILDNPPIRDQDKLSNNLFRIFQFVSEYADR